MLYIFDKNIAKFWNKNCTRRDAKLLRNTDYKILKDDEIKEEHYARIVELYKQLYLDKYTIHSPHLTEEVIKAWHTTKFITLHGIYDCEEDSLVGIIGFLQRDDIVVTAFMGYEMSVPQEKGLYRLLMILLIKYAHEHDLRINLSAGADDFKLKRGGIASLEKQMIYCQHLPWRRRFIWRLLQFIFNNFVNKL